MAILSSRLAKAVFISQLYTPCYSRLSQGSGSGSRKSNIFLNTLYNKVYEHILYSHRGRTSRVSLSLTRSHVTYNATLNDVGSGLYEKYRILYLYHFFFFIYILYQKDTFETENKPILYYTITARLRTKQQNLLIYENKV